MTFGALKQAGKLRLALWMVWGRFGRRGQSRRYPQSFLRKALKLYIDMGHFHRENRGPKWLAQAYIAKAGI
ncbi:MAG: hypothetical protein ABIO63_13675 [Casimicrobiaceae bacterium]